MKKIDPYPYYLGVYKCEKPHSLINKGKSIVLAVETPTKYIISMRQLVAVAHNYFDTLYIKKWINKPELRFLAFIFMETQINKILDELKRDKVLVVIANEELEDVDKCIEIILDDERDEDFSYLKKLAAFRLKLEREK